MIESIDSIYDNCYVKNGIANVHSVRKGEVMANFIFEKRQYCLCHDEMKTRLTSEEGVTDLISDFTDAYYAVQVRLLKKRKSLTAKMKLEQIQMERLLRKIKIIERRSGENAAKIGPLLTKFIKHRQNFEQLCNTQTTNQLAANC